jgi:hypothetical protein
VSWRLPWGKQALPHIWWTDLSLKAGSTIWFDKETDSKVNYCFLHFFGVWSIRLLLLPPKLWS